MLNWRRDPDYERRMNALAIRIQKTETVTRQIESEILRVRNDSERIERETKLIESDTKLIERDTERIRKETERIRKETEQLRLVNARTRALISCIDQQCFPPESSSTPAPPIEPG